MRFGKSALLLVPALLLLVAFFLLPSLDVVQASLFDPDFTTRHFLRIAERGVYLKVFWRTLEVSAVVALLAAAIGYPIAYYINLQPRRLQFLLIFLIFIPLWMSILIRSYAWMVLLGRDGIVNTALLGLGLVDKPARLLFTTGAVLLFPRPLAFSKSLGLSRASIRLVCVDQSASPLGALAGVAGSEAKPPPPPIPSDGAPRDS